MRGRVYWSLRGDHPTMVVHIDRQASDCEIAVSSMLEARDSVRMSVWRDLLNHNLWLQRN